MMMDIMRTHRRTIRRGLQRARTAWFAAAAGSMRPGTAGRPAAATAIPAADSTFSASAFARFQWTSEARARHTILETTFTAEVQP